MAQAIGYFDAILTYAAFDRMSDAFAVDLIEVGGEAGDRVALYLQNIPHFQIAILAA